MKDSVKYDKYGRIIIENEQLLKEIAGATNSNQIPELDAACGNNSSCTNTNCGAE